MAVQVVDGMVEVRQGLVEKESLVVKGSLVLRVSYWGHKISKSTSVDGNKIYVVTV